MNSPSSRSRNYRTASRSASRCSARPVCSGDDITELAAAIPAGASALLVALELVYQRELAARTAESGAVLLGYERIPAPVVNALMDTIIPKLEV
ncbi:hypothetical protein GCM10020255_017810 [Rhodococcus baikonurensis]